VASLPVAPNGTPRHAPLGQREHALLKAYWIERLGGIPKRKQQQKPVLATHPASLFRRQILHACAQITWRAG
jgi:hypothetical protein